MKEKLKKILVVLLTAIIAVTEIPFGGTNKSEAAEGFTVSYHTLGRAIGVYGEKYYTYMTNNNNGIPLFCQQPTNTSISGIYSYSSTNSSRALKAVGYYYYKTGDVYGTAAATWDAIKGGTSAVNSYGVSNNTFLQECKGMAERGELDDYVTVYNVYNNIGSQALIAYSAREIERKAFISINKTGEHTGKNANLEGAVYGVFSDEKCNKLIAKMQPTDINGYAKSLDALGVYTNYYIQELVAPIGTKLSTKIYSVKTGANGTTTSVNSENNVSNEETSIQVEVYKTGNSGIKLKDAQFTLYEWSNTKKKYVNAKNANISNGITVITTNSNGYAKTGRLYYTKDNLGKWKIDETKAPAGYSVTTNPKEIQALKNEDKEVTWNVSDNELSAKIRFQKIVEDKDGNAISGTKKAGYAFTIYTDKTLKKVAKTKEGKNAVAITGENGLTSFLTLDVAEGRAGTTYYYKETGVVSGSTSTGKIGQVNLVDGDKKTEKNEATTNYPWCGKILVKKIKNNDTTKPVKGVKFQIWEWNNTTYRKHSVIVSDEKGIAASGDLVYTEANKGKFKVTELSTDGTDVILDSTWEREFAIKDGHAKEFIVTKSNAEKSGKFVIDHKTAVNIDGEGKNCTYEGIEYTLFSKWKVSGTKVVGDTSENKYRIALDVNGKGNISNVAPGNYLLVETKGTDAFVNDHMTDMTNTMLVTIKANQTLTVNESAHGVYSDNSNVNIENVIIKNGNGEAVTVSGVHQYDENALVNLQKKMYVSVLKVNSVTEKALSGAEFEFSQWSKKENAYIKLGTYKTNDKGNITNADGTLLYVYYTNDNMGKFQLIETKAPDGYIANWSKKFSFADAAKTENGFTSSFTSSFDATEKISQDFGIDRTSQYTWDSNAAVTPFGVSTTVEKLYESAGKTIPSGLPSYLPISLLKDNQKGKLGLTVSKYITYNGRKIDMKLTFTNWTFKNGLKDTDRPPLVSLTNNRYIFFNCNIQSMDYRYEFFDSETGTPVAIKGVFAFNDIDYDEGINPVTADKVYLPSYTNLRKISVNGEDVYADSQKRKADDVGVSGNGEPWNKHLLLFGSSKSYIDVHYETQNKDSIEPWSVSLSSESLHFVNGTTTYNSLYYIDNNVPNNPQSSAIILRKKDEQNGELVSGAEFVVMDGEKTIGTMIDNGNGVYSLENINMEGNTVRTLNIVESKTPYGYVNVNNQIVGKITVNAGRESYLTIDEIPVSVNINGKKITDASFVGDASYEGAVYGLYMDSDCKESPVDLAVCDKDGNFAFKTRSLDFADVYYIKEIKAPVGFELSNEIVSADVKGEYNKNNKVTTVRITVMAKENVITAPISVKKYSQSREQLEKDEKAPLAGATFSVYLASMLGGLDISNNEVLQNYNFSDKKAITTFKTDEDGKGVSSALPYGTYVIVETGVPSNHDKCENSIARITGGVDSVTSFTLIDKRYSAPVQIMKIDAVKNEAVPVIGTTFKIYDVTNKKYVQEYVQREDENGNLVDSTKDLVIAVDEKGIGYSPDLAAGTYRVEEYETAPGYLPTSETVTLVIGKESKDEIRKDGTKFYYAKFSNEPTKVEISKTDMVTGEPVVGAKLEIYNEDNEIVDSWITKNEVHKINALPLGKYTLIETIAPEGYATAAEVEFEVKETGDIQRVEMKDAPLTLDVSKVSALTKLSVAGATLQIIPIVYDDMPNPLENTLLDVSFEPIENDDNNEIRIINLKNNGEELDNVIIYTGMTPDSMLNETLDYDKEIAVDNGDGTITLSKFKKNQSVTIKVKVSKNELYNDVSIRLADVPKVTFQEGKIYKEWITNGEITEFTNIPIGNYILREKNAPDGYVIADDLEFSIIDTEEVQFIELKEDMTKLLVNKYEAGLGIQIEGAKMQIINEKGEVVNEFTTTSEPEYITGLKAGKYVLHEVEPPTGYCYANDVEFEVENTAEQQAVSMEDLTTKVQISKMDLTTGEEIDGAELTITNKDGEVVQRWITDRKTPVQFDRLPAGEYTLTEIAAPSGYAKADTVEFEIKDDGNITRVEMKDDVIKVDISKVDFTSKEELPGAELQIINADGEIVESWVSQKSPHRITALPAGIYILREKAAPEGYTCAQEIEFEVKDIAQIQKIIMEDKRKIPEIEKITDPFKETTTPEEITTYEEITVPEKITSSNETEVTTTPSTGDSNDFMTILILCAAAVSISLIITKKSSLRTKEK